MVGDLGANWLLEDSVDAEVGLVHHEDGAPHYHQHSGGKHSTVEVSYA